MRAIRSLGSLLLLAALPAFQGGDRPDRPDRPDRDPPSRVGRLSYLSGPVSFRPGDVDDWTDATINYPLHNRDHLWTDTDAPAEITGAPSALRPGLGIPGAPGAAGVGGGGGPPPLRRRRGDPLGRRERVVRQP